MAAPTRGSVPGYPQTPAPLARSGLSTGAIVGIVAGVLALALAAVAVVVVLIVSAGGTVRLMVPGAGMEPTIQAGQTVSAAEVDPGKYQPGRGDIVVFTPPHGWLAGEGDQKLIKRVIGLPGERVICCDAEGRWTINGTPLDEPYVNAGRASAGPPVDVTVPDGRLWLLGDNRTASGDSHTMFSTTREISDATVPVSAVSAVVKG